MSEQELKSCPCCGGPVEMSYFTSKGLKIKCKSCIVKLEQKVRGSYSLEWLKVKMIETWNTRVSESRIKELEAENKRLREALKEYNSIK